MKPRDLKKFGLGILNYCRIGKLADIKLPKIEVGTIMCYTGSLDNIPDGWELSKVSLKFDGEPLPETAPIHYI